jgi:hypothetical protein
MTILCESPMCIDHGNAVASWSALVIDERRVTSSNKREVSQLVSFLDRHLGWLTAHLAAHDFADEIAALAEAARNILDPDHARHMELGRREEFGCGPGACDDPD